MKTSLSFRRAGLFSILLLSSFALRAQPLPLAGAEDLGFSTARLDKLHAFVQGHIDAGHHAGAISLICRGGAIVDWQTYGHRDLEAKLPMENDTIVRIYSMTKPITSVAVMMLVEEGRIKLDDPISRYLPEFTSMKVFKGGTAEAPELVDARTPITIKHLLTHTSGMTYDFGNSPVEQINKKADLWGAPTFEEFITRAAKLPLAHEPGEKWTYGISIDVLGRLVEVVSGQKFEDFLEARVFKPLDMVDTAFYVPESRKARQSKIFEAGPDGKLRPARPILNCYVEPGVGFPSGGGGLYSTIGDYARFAQMLLNRGKLGDSQLLGRKTVDWMMANHLNGLAQPTISPNGAEGFGLGGSVRVDLAKGNGPGSEGQFGWTGAATTYFNIDPREDTLVLLFVQHFPYDQHGIFSKFSTLFYSALVD